MNHARFILNSISLFLILFSSVAFAANGLPSIPSSMEYFPEGRNISLKFPVSSYLDNLAAQKKLDFYGKPQNLLVDAIMADEKLDKAILISVNRRTRPEFLNKVYQHPQGQFFQVQIHDQQLAMFFYRFSDAEAQETLDQIRKDRQVAKKLSVFILEAQAETYSETARAHSAPADGSGGQSVKAPTHEYVFGEEWVGCGIGFYDGLSSMALYPWDAVVQASQGTKDLFNDPKGFWNRSVDQFKGLVEVAKKFREHIGNGWENIQRKSVKEKSQLWCNFLGVSGVIGVAGKAAQGAGLFSKGFKVPPVNPDMKRASSALAKIDKHISKNFFAIKRGTATEAQAKNQTILKTLNAAELPKPNPKRLEGIDQKKINELFLKVKKNPVADICNYSKYDPSNEGIGFCFGRATAAHIEALNTGLAKDRIRKVWVVGNLNTGATSWGYHVTTIVKGSDGKWWAIDPILGAPVTVEQWYAKMKTFDVEGNLRLFTSEAKRFGPGSPNKYNPDYLNDSRFNNYFNDLMDHFKEESREVMNRAKMREP